ncbi:hypothetical protein [uncultured Chryseobacterium sp.]|jgi:hypothetical protein|uniref:hypothetical protein n=1 Tax=uncultured Chryseobacterium sp. TaxID=259322 RepID=UPI002601DFAF|nr:hypothetical protein [uncultured Chryseobacterium sp.]
MEKIKFLIALFILSSCSMSKELKNERQKWNFNHWENEYKDRAFCLCILKGYEDKKIEKIFLEKDRSFYNPLGIAIFDKSLKPIIDNEIKKIRQDSINSLNKYPEDLKGIYEKRQVLAHCLKFYTSKELDNLAKKEKENWNKIPNILDEIHKEIPTY